MANKSISDRTAAKFIANHENGSQEWHDLRATGIGGSEVGTICGLNKWESAYTLAAKKLGKIPADFKTSEAMEWGTRLEPVILEKFEDEHPELTVHKDVGTWQHAEREWQIANPDGIFETAAGELGIIEVKTAQFEDDWAAGVPAYYETQVQWYLQTFGFEQAYVVALFHGNRYREYAIQASEMAQEVNLAAVERFRTYLEEDQLPDFDGSENTYQTVRVQHPDIIDEEVELGQLGLHYFTAQEELAAAEKKATEMKSRVLDALGSAKKGTLDGTWIVTRQARGTGSPFLVNKRG